MTVRMQQIKDAEDRMKASVSSALTSTFAVAFVLLVIVVFGIVFAEH